MAHEGIDTILRLIDEALAENEEHLIELGGKLCAWVLADVEARAEHKVAA